MKKSKEISEELYNKVRPCGSQAARFYGLAKVHKQNTPVRPIVSMPGSAYHKLAVELGCYLKRLPQANINVNVPKVQESITSLSLEPDEDLVSLDVVSLFTNVPVKEAIIIAANKLFDNENIEKPDMSQSTFVKLLEMVSVNVLFCDREGTFYRQTDGVAMGSPVAPLLANLFLSQFDQELGSHSITYFKYVDDVIRSMLKGGKQFFVDFVNTMHEQ